MNTIELILTIRIRKYNPAHFRTPSYCSKNISDMCYVMENCSNSIPLCPDIILCKQNCKVCWQKAIDKVKEGGNPVL